ncbi:MAG TPA: ferritin-like domain-containing protein [Terriglobales bacterium]|nr:ferritin-like domain-containing protein [Terriglobales bacterium]
MPHFVQDVEEIRQRARQKIEDGPITSTYELDKDQTVEILNEALATEIVCVLRYMHHYFMATGVHGAAARDEFKEHADQERQHAEKVADRIQQLGGKPDFNPKGLLERSVAHYVEGETLADMIREDLVAERVVIDVYREMIKHFGDKDPTSRIMIEDILQEEEEHANDLADLLYVVNPSTGETEVQDPGTEIGQSDREEEMDWAEGRSASNRSQPNVREWRGSEVGQGRQSPQRTEIRRQEEKKMNTSERPGRGERNDRRGESAPQRSNVSFNGAAQRARGQSNMAEQPAMESNEHGGRRNRSEARPARATGDERPGSRKDVAPAHPPGTTGRVMARRGRNNIEPADDDIAMGGQAGSSRSPKVTNKNRKNRAA